MKAVMISILPEWVEKIVNEEKTIEVRKTRPKIDTPFKCYIYCCKAKDDYHILEWHDWDAGKITRLDGKVIGEFVCDRIHEWTYNYKVGEYNIGGDSLRRTCLLYHELENYGKGKTLYGWHISDLKIYDKPKGIEEFYQETAQDACLCDGCVYHEYPISTYPCNECGCDRKYLYRAPQSWCYVEEV